VPGGITWVFAPFTVKGTNVWAVTRAPTELTHGEPATLAGFHWPWKLAKATLAGERGSIALPARTGKGLPAVLFSFEAPVASDLRARWPAVMGKQGTDAGHVSAAHFVALRPAMPGTKHRLWVVDENGRPLPEVGADSGAEACGKGCLDFPDYPTFLDTPVSYSRSLDGLLRVDGRAVKFVFAATSGLARDRARDLLRKADLPGRGDALFEDLSARWGRFADTFTVHVVLTGGCSYQGLEHGFSTALTFGVECGGREPGSFAALLAHEIVHAWNVKRLVPREHERTAWMEFPADRTRQLYFYEGFTEGLARLEMATRFADVARLSDRVSNWNATFASLRALGVTGRGRDMEALSREDAFRGYAVGAWLALRAGLVARAGIIATEGTSTPFGAARAAEAYGKVLNVIGRLVLPRGGKAVVDDRPLSEALVFGRYLATLDTERFSRGYDKSSLRAAFRVALGLSEEHPFLEEFFGEKGPFPAPRSLDDALRAAAADAGLASEENAGGGIVVRVPTSVPLGSTFPF
jgi:hypothetical protein